MSLSPYIFVTFISSILFSVIFLIMVAICSKNRLFVSSPLASPDALLAGFSFCLLRLLLPVEWSYTTGFPLPGLYSEMTLWITSPFFSSGSFSISVFQCILTLFAAGAVLNVLSFFIRLLKDWHTLLGTSTPDPASAALIEQLYHQIPPMKLALLRKILHLSQLISLFQRRNQDLIFRNQPVPVYRSNLISIPMSIGVFRCAVFLPEQTCSEEELRFILLHEYTHIRMQDPQRRFLLHLIRCLLWWNPLVILLEHQICEQMEFRCDALCMEGKNAATRSAYLSAILTSITRKHKKHESHFKSIIHSPERPSGNIPSEDHDSRILQSDDNDTTDGNRISDTSFHTSMQLYSHSEKMMKRRFLRVANPRKKELSSTGNWILIFSLCGLFLFSYRYMPIPSFPDPPIKEIVEDIYSISLCEDGSLIFLSLDGEYVTAHPNSEDLLIETEEDLLFERGSDHCTFRISPENAHMLTEMGIEIRQQ